VISLPKNMGAGGARYHGALAATGTHIASLDADDYWYPEKLEKQAAFVTQVGDPRGIYSHQQWVEEGGGGSIRPDDGPRPGEPISEYLLVRNGFIQSNTIMVEREAYLQLCRVSDELYADDWALTLRADLLQCRVYLLKEALSHWNCTADPKRFSNSRNVRYDRNYELWQARYFTPKAKAAFGGRWLAPRLIKQGQLFDALWLVARQTLPWPSV